MAIFNKCNDHTKIIFFIVVCSFMLNACKVQEKTIYVYQNKHETFNYPINIFPNVNPIILDGTYFWEYSRYYSLLLQSNNTDKQLERPRWVISDSATTLFKRNKTFNTYLRNDSLFVWDSAAVKVTGYKIVIPSYDSLYLISKSLAKMVAPTIKYDTVINLFAFKRIDDSIIAPEDIDSFIKGRWYMKYPKTIADNEQFIIKTPRDTLTFYDDSLAVLANQYVEAIFKYEINTKNRTLTYKLTDTALYYNGKPIFESDDRYFIYKLTPDYLELIPASLDCECKHTIGYRKFGYD